MGHYEIWQNSRDSPKVRLNRRPIMRFFFSHPFFSLWLIPLWVIPFYALMSTFLTLYWGHLVCFFNMDKLHPHSFFYRSFSKFRQKRSTVIKFIFNKIDKKKAKSKKGVKTKAWGCIHLFYSFVFTFCLFLVDLLNIIIIEYL